MRFSTALKGKAGGAAALALLAVSLAMPGAVSAQGTGAGASADPAKRGQARLCVNAYNSLLKADSRFVADNRAAIETRRQALSKKFGIAAPAITPDGSRIGELLVGFMSDQIIDCENQFADMPAFQPRISISRVLLMAPAAPTPPAPPPAPPVRRFSDLTCSSIFWVAGLAWPQEREGWLNYANRAVAQHLAATPNDTMAQAEARVMADGQARARLLQEGGAETDRFMRDLTVCADQFGIRPNAASGSTPAQPSADRSPQALYDEGRQLLQTDKAGGLRLILQACDKGHLDACVGYAQIGGPQGRSAETDKAIGFALGKACTLGDGLSCYYVAYSLDPSNMLGGFVREARSFDDAKKFYQRACREHQINDACMSLMTMEDLMGMREW